MRETSPEMFHSFAAAFLFVALALLMGAQAGEGNFVYGVTAEADFAEMDNNSDMNISPTELFTAYNSNVGEAYGADNASQFRKQYVLYQKAETKERRKERGKEKQMATTPLPSNRLT